MLTSFMKTKPCYLFVCVENACRSQMAEGLFNALTEKATARSAGTKPSVVNTMAIEVMKEVNIDISAQKPKIITPELVRDAQKVITMGCTSNCPFTPFEKTIKWDIPDPKGKPKEFFLEVRNLLEDKIMRLLKDENLLI